MGCWLSSEINESFLNANQKKTIYLVPSPSGVNSRPKIMKYFPVLLFICLFINPVGVAGQQDWSGFLKGELLYYKTFGKGIQVLIINGGPGMNSEGFSEVAENISEFGVRTIIYDQRGTGNAPLTEISEKTMTLDLMVADIEELRKTLKIEKWVVMGHSFGGMLAYAYAAKYPQNILGMIQSSSGGMDLSLLQNIDINSFLSPAERDSLTYYNRRLQAGDTTYATRYKRGMFMAPAYVFDKKHIPVIAHRLTQGNSVINSLIWQNLREERFDVKEKMRNFKKPVLIIQGREDILGTDLALEAHEILPNSELLLLKDTRHYGWLDNEALFYEAIEHFLKEYITR